jgi:phage gp16-like protein
MNWQHCARQCFAGISFSYESYYQAIRRSWRFGQTRPVHVHVVCADTERAIWTVVARKAGDHDAMKREMAAAMRRSMNEQKSKITYSPNQEARLPAWIAA